MKRNALYLMLLMMATFFACSHEQEEEPQLTASLEQENPLEWNAGSVKIKVETNVDFSIEIPDDCDWCGKPETRSVDSFTVEMRLEDNTSGQQRNVKVAFVNGQYNLREVLEIIQNSKGEDPDKDPDPDPQPENEQHLLITHNNQTMVAPELKGDGLEAWIMWNPGMEWEVYKTGMSHTYTGGSPYRLEIKGTEINEVYVPKITEITVVDFTNF